MAVGSSGSPLQAVDIDVVAHEDQSIPGWFDIENGLGSDARDLNFPLGNLDHGASINDDRDIAFSSTDSDFRDAEGIMLWRNGRVQYQRNTIPDDAITPLIDCVGNITYSHFDQFKSIGRSGGTRDVNIIDITEPAPNEPANEINLLSSDKGFEMRGSGPGGSTMFKANVFDSSSGNDRGRGLYSIGGGYNEGIVEVARTGDIVDGPGEIDTFDSIDINLSNDSTFGAKLTGTGVTADNDTGLFFERAADAALPFHTMAREGEIAPGSGGFLFDDLEGTRLEIDNEGIENVAFAAEFRDPNTGNEVGAAIYEGSLGEASTLLVGPDDIPGSNADLLRIASLSYGEDGAVTFASVNGGVGDANGVYTWDDGVITEVFNEFSPSSSSSGFVGNPLSVLASKDGFIAVLTGDFFDKALYSVDPEGDYQLVAETGVTSLMGGTLDSIDLAPQGMNRRGEIAFSFTLADGSTGVALFDPNGGNPVNNNNFEAGVANWSVAGSGTFTTAVTNSADTVAVLTAGSPVTISQTIDTTVEGDMIPQLIFDYKILQNSGNLEVMVDGNIVESLDASQIGQMSEFATREISLMEVAGLESADLEFTWDGSSGDQIQLDDVGVYSVPEPRFWGLAAGFLALGYVALRKSRSGKL